MKTIGIALCLCWTLTLPAEGLTQTIVQPPAPGATQGPNHERMPASQPIRKEASARALPAEGMTQTGVQAPGPTQGQGLPEAAPAALEEAPTPAALPGPGSAVAGEAALFGEPLRIAPIQRPKHWLFEEVDPIQRERRLLTRMREQRARSSISMQRQQPLGRDMNAEVRQWRFSIGNTSVSNWSPYPDRALDARTIRFPLPRNMTPPKGPSMPGAKK